MKWIGQHIYDNISRFRDDVYLEDVTESVQGHVVGIDANGKLYKQDVSAGDLTSIVAGTGLSGTDLTGPIPTLNVDASQTQITGVGTIGTGVWNGTAVASAYLDTDTAHLSGTQSFTGTKTFDETISGAIDGNAATATNLTASTSTAVGLGTIELGHATDTTIARSAAGIATIEGKKVQTRDKVIFMETSNFSDDINTDAHYIPFITTAEHASFANVAVPFVAPTAGKLLGVHYRSNVHTNTSSNTVTFRLDRLDDGVLWANGNQATIGTKVVDGTAREDTCSADFQDLTTSGSSGTNAFDAGEMIGVSLQNSQNLTSTKYSVTLVFEFDFDSY